MLLTDLVMPGIDGFDIVRVLAENRPDLPVVCMFGFTTQAAAGRGLQVPFVPKPFTLEPLRGAITPLIAHSREVRRESEAARHRAAHGRATTVDWWLPPWSCGGSARSLCRGVRFDRLRAWRNWQTRRT